MILFFFAPVMQHWHKIWHLKRATYSATGTTDGVTNTKTKVKDGVDKTKSKTKENVEKVKEKVRKDNHGLEVSTEAKAQGEIKRQNQQ